MDPDLQHLTAEIPIETTRDHGTVRWFSDQKGYGFIEPADGGDDVFVRYSSVDGDGFRTLVAGQQVTYERADDGRGPRALAVRAA
jgi:cold shock protein